MICKCNIKQYEQLGSIIIILVAQHYSHQRQSGRYELVAKFDDASS